MPWHSGVRDQTIYLPRHQRPGTPALSSHRLIYPCPQRQPAAAAGRSLRRHDGVRPSLPGIATTSTLRYARAVSRETSTSTCRRGHGVSRETRMPAVPARCASVPSPAKLERRRREFSARRSLSKRAASVSGKHKRPRERGDTRRAAWRLALRGIGERPRGDSRLAAPVGTRPGLNAMPAERKHPHESFRPMRRLSPRSGTVGPAEKARQATNRNQPTCGAGKATVRIRHSQNFHFPAGAERPVGGALTAVGGRRAPLPTGHIHCPVRNVQCARTPTSWAP